MPAAKRKQPPAAMPEEWRTAFESILKRYNNQGHQWVAREIGARRETMLSWVSGSDAPREKHLRGIAGLLAWLAQAGPAGPDGDDGRAWALALGRSLTPEYFSEAWRIKGSDRLRMGEPQLWSAGLHVAPFRDEHGNPLLVSIDQKNCLRGESVITIHEGPDDDQMRLPMFGRGVHLCPWHPKAGQQGGFMASGWVMVAVDSDRCRRASLDVPGGYWSTHLADSKADLEAVLDLLDSVTAPAYSDGYEHKEGDALGEDQDDRGYDSGDVWKRGTIYDVGQNKPDQS